jgi:hypothetical protein
MITRLGALTIVVAVGFPLAACTSFSNTVSDHWPTWAGGMPPDVPPRPGAPGYDEFIAHQQASAAAPPAALDGTATPPPVPTPGMAAYSLPSAYAAPAGARASSTVVSTAAPPTAAAPPPPGYTYPQAAPPAQPRPNDQAAVQGGLY